MTQTRLLGFHSKVTWDDKSDSKMGSRVTFKPILGHFGVGLPEPLLGHFNSFCVSRKSSLRAQKLKKFKIALQDWNFQARLKISSEPPAKPPFSVGNSEGQHWKFQARLKFSSEIENFKRDWNVSIFGPSGLGARPMHTSGWRLHIFMLG